MSTWEELRRECLNCRKCRILGHKYNCHILYLRHTAIIILICRKHKLLLRSPLDQLIRSRTYRLRTIIIAVGMLRHYADGRKRIEKNRSRLR